MNQQPLLTIKVKYTKIFLMFLIITLLQCVSYYFFNTAIKYRFNSTLILTILSIIEIICIFFSIKNGLPQIKLYESHCIIQLYISKIQFNYDQVASISINNSNKSYKFLPVGNQYIFRLEFKQNQNLLNLFTGTIQPVKFYSNFHLDTFTNKQILELYLLFQIIIPLDRDRRITTLKNLNLQHIKIEQISDCNDLKNFKNNQYLSKKFPT